jgi:hypothetical protein
MKNISAGVVMALGILICFGAHSQELEFSRVLKVSNATETVPEGKVWKVVSFLQQGLGLNTNGNSCTDPNRTSPFVIDGQIYYSFQVATGAGGIYFTPTPVTFPIWLPEGSTLSTICVEHFLSVIEFSVL